MGHKPAYWTPAEYQQNLLAPVGRAVISMERTGIPVNLDTLRFIESAMSHRAEELLHDLRDWTNGRDINWNSWQQLAAWLHNDANAGEDDGGPGLGIKPSPYCKKGEVPDDKIATDDRALQWLAGHNPDHRDPITKLRNLRQCIRMGRYARNWLATALPYGDGTYRLHPSFGLGSDFDTRAGAVTGRFGVKNPPLNQVPRDPKKDPAGMRAAFVPPPGMKLIVVDYSQLEVVILSHIIALLFGDDDPLVTRVRAGEDIHGPAARYIFGEIGGDAEVAAAATSDFKKIPKLIELRGLGKVGIYGKNYGKRGRGFAWSTFLDSGEPLGLERGNLLSDGLDRFYPGVPKYQDFIRQHITRNRNIASLWGRWQPMVGASSQRVGERNRAWRQSLNYPMQATGQEIMAFALITIITNQELHELGYVLSLVVHDEIVGWAPEANAERCRELVEYLMITCVELLAPLRGEGKTGYSWKECK